MSETLTGRVVTVREDKGFCFIERADGGGDIFAHTSDCGFTLPQQGDRVSFTIGEGRNGKSAAKDVTVLDDT